MQLDQITVKNFPLIAAPQSDVVETPSKAGIRYVVARNGLWRAIDKSWLSALTPVALDPDAVIPYGRVAQTVKFLCGMPPASLWREFAAVAKTALPNEVAVAMVWNSMTDCWRLAVRESIEANGGYVHYQEAELNEDEEMVVDIHSHGHHPAFFSKTDDSDDFGSIKVAAVLGRVGTVAAQLVARLMLIDRCLDLELLATGGWKLNKENNETQDSQ